MNYTMSKTPNVLQLKYDSYVFHKTRGLGNIRGKIIDSVTRLVKFQNSEEVVATDIRECIVIPYNKDNYLYYNNEPCKVLEVCLENDTIKYKVSDINEQLTYNIDIHDKKISKRLKKDKQEPEGNVNKIDSIFEKINTLSGGGAGEESSLTTTPSSNSIKKELDFSVIDKLSNQDTNDSIQTPSSFSKTKLCALLLQRYNKNIENINNLRGRLVLKQVSGNVMNSIITKCKLSFNHVDKIIQTIEKYHDSSLELYNLTINPFDFIKEEFQLITFEKAEKISKEYKLDIPFEIKCVKWCYDLLRKLNTFYINSRSFYWNFETFCKNNAKNHKNYIDVVNELMINKKIVNSPCKTTNYLITLEKKMSDSMMELFYEKIYAIQETLILDGISSFELLECIELTMEQKTAVIKSITNKFNIILGFPGTGKSTIVKCILYVLNIIYDRRGDIRGDIRGDRQDEIDCEKRVTSCLEEPLYSSVIDCSKYPNYKNISLLGPTGLSYVGLAAKCAPSINKFNKTISGTCHRIIYNIYPKIKKIMEKKRDVLTEVDSDLVDIIPELIIVDESSMVDSYMFNDILEWCNYFKCRLLLLGDENQLPSIGPGQVLEDLIYTNIFSDTKLTEIKRNNGSLMTNIKKMTNDTLTRDDFVDDSFTFIDIDELLVNDLLHYPSIQQLIQTRCFTKDNSKFLSYFKNDKYNCNVINLNNILQSVFNPSGISYQSKNKFGEKFAFKKGDIIIRIENDYKNGDIRANGEQAVIVNRDVSTGAIVIKYMEDNSKYVHVDIETLYAEFMLAYALTVHKSQGSQYDFVIIFIDKDQNIWDKKALYTAISRAQKGCVVIGKMKDFIKIQENKGQDKYSLFMKESDKYDFS